MTLIKKRFDRHVMERLPTPYPVYSWVTCDKTITEDAFRADEYTQPHRVGFEGSSAFLFSRQRPFQTIYRDK